MPPLPLRDDEPRRVQPAPAKPPPGPDTAALIAELKSLGYIVYRKPARRRGRFITFTNDAGETVRLEQLEVRPRD